MFLSELVVFREKPCPETFMESTVLYSFTWIGQLILAAHFELSITLEMSRRHLRKTFYIFA